MRRTVIWLAAVLSLAAASPAAAQEPPTKDEPTQISPAEPGGGGVEVVSVELWVGGERVDAAPPGVEVLVRVVLRNAGSEPMRGARARLVAPAEDEARVVDGEASYGDLAAGEEAAGEFRLVIDRGRCNEFLGLGAELAYEGGTAPFKLAVPATCPGPRLSLEEVRYEGGDGDGVPEPGETLRVLFTLRNDGRDPATGVGARVELRGRGVTSAGGAVEWPDIRPGASARSTSVVVTIADDAPRQEGCQGLPRGEPVPVIAEKPPVAEGTVAPDTPVSSDGQTGGSTGAGGSAVDGGPSGGGASGSEPGSPGTVEPEPGTISVVPAPGGSIEPGGTQPDPGAPEPSPEPAEPQDLPVLVEGSLRVAAGGYETTIDYSNGIACALEGGLVDKAAPALARDDARTGGGAALPLLVSMLAAAAAVFARSALAR